MDRFRQLVVAALIAGAAAGFVLFLLQHWFVVPLIEQAETYESAAHAGMEHDEGWQPAEGFQRVALTAVSSMLAGIGFAALLVAAMSLQGRRIDLRQGVLWGLAGFACFSLAPALGLPPAPPGSAEGDLFARQAWWAGTAAATALGLWLLVAGRIWLWRIAGLAALLLPHLIGAPVAEEAGVVPAALARSFALASIGTTGVFWLILGGLCGQLLQQRRFLNQSLS